MSAVPEMRGGPFVQWLTSEHVGLVRALIDKTRGLYGPWLGDTLTRSMDTSQRLNGSNADAGFKLVKSLGARQVYIYAMAQEPWLTFISSRVYDESSLAMRQARQLIGECTPRGIHAELLCGSKDLGALE